MHNYSIAAAQQQRAKSAVSERRKQEREHKQHEQPTQLALRANRMVPDATRAAEQQASRVNLMAPDTNNSQY